MEERIRAVLEEVAEGTLTPEEGARRIEGLEGRGAEVDSERLEAEAEGLSSEAEALEEVAERLEEAEEELAGLEEDAGDDEGVRTGIADRRDEIDRRRQELSALARELSTRRRELRDQARRAKHARRHRRTGAGLHGLDRLISGSIGTALEAVRSSLEGLGPLIEDSVRSVDVALRHAGASGRVVVTNGPTVSDTLEAQLSAEEGTPIVVSSDAGSVEVRRGSDAGNVRVIAERHGQTDKDIAAMDVRMENDSGTVRIEYRAGDWPAVNRWVRFRIEAPASCPVRVETRAGGVTLDGLERGAEARTSGGPIRASQVRGPMELRTSGGPIRVTDVEGRLDASTAGGPIDVHRAKLEGPCVLVTQGGSIVLAGAEGETVEARTSGGNIEVSGRITGSCILHTSGGNIRASQIDANVDARTSAGRITVEGRLAGTSVLRTSVGTIDVALPADSRLRLRGRGRRVSTDFDVRVDDGRIDGELGDGGEGTLEMESDNGSINVRRA